MQKEIITIYRNKILLYMETKYYYLWKENITIYGNKYSYVWEQDIIIHETKYNHIWKQNINW